MFGINKWEGVSSKSPVAFCALFIRVVLLILVVVVHHISNGCHHRDYDCPGHQGMQHVDQNPAKRFTSKIKSLDRS